MPKETRPPGRPEGKTYPHSKVIRFRDEDVERLQRLAQALGAREGPRLTPLQKHANYSPQEA
jgi:hypothetical protein